MYRIEFIKKNLTNNGTVIDEEIGEVYVQNLYEPNETGEIVGYKVKGILYSTGTEFENKKSAEQFAKEYKNLYSKWPDRYKVTTEVYYVN